MTHINLPSGEWLLVKVPAGSTDVFINNVGCLRYTHNKWSSVIEPAQMGEYLDYRYQLHGSDPLNLTEEEAAQVVDAVSGWDHIIYYNYMAGGRDYRDIVESAFKSPLASYLTLLTAHGHKVGECVTLKKVK